MEPDPDLLVGINTVDDAAVYRLNDDLALVQTVDFFTPVVDSPYDFGRIAATNSFSDIYAMGGKPVTALNIVGFPTDLLPLTDLEEILRGGMDVAKTAGARVVGGHTIDDREPKYGMAVTGVLKPGSEITNRRARAGDALILTKPLGTGVVVTAIKRGVAESNVVEKATEVMLQLNEAPSEAAVAVGVDCMTDVTGFGLLGHLWEMCTASGVSAEVWLEDVPFLPGAEELAASGVVPGGTKRNLEYLTPSVCWGDDLENWEKLLLADAQTSGGLLVAVSPEQLPDFRAELASRGVGVAAFVGRISEGDFSSITVQRRAPRVVGG